MAFISLPANQPGMQRLLAYRPAIAPPLLALMQTLMRDESQLSLGERELIATTVSEFNECKGCSSIHGAIASCHYQKPIEWGEQVADNFTDLPDRVVAVLEFALLVAEGGSTVRENDVLRLRSFGYTDETIHDIVLIAALFCMFNRYIDGLGLVNNDSPESLAERAKLMAAFGYKKH